MPASLADPLGPFALGGSPGQAFASHKARAVGIAWKFVVGGVQQQCQLPQLRVGQ